MELKNGLKSRFYWTSTTEAWSVLDRRLDGLISAAAWKVYLYEKF